MPLEEGDFVEMIVEGIELDLDPKVIVDQERRGRVFGHYMPP